MFIEPFVQPCRRSYNLHNFDTRYLPPATAEGEWVLVDLSKGMCMNEFCICKPRLIPVYSPRHAPQKPLGPTEIIAQNGMDADMANDYLQAIGRYTDYLTEHTASIHGTCSTRGFSAAPPPLTPQQYFKQLYPDAPFSLFAFLEPAPTQIRYSPISPPRLLFAPSLCSLAGTAA